jgi:uncharacterized protein YndB with AHSA1/START domain
MMDETVMAPIVKERTVPLPVGRAFRLFTAGMGTWWPLSSHSISFDSVSKVVFEEWDGGRLYEFTRKGDEHIWGHVVAWNPPMEVAFSWHPGRASSTAQRVDLHFESADVHTRVTLTHSGWEALGPDAAQTRDGYVTGWDHVLDGSYIPAAVSQPQVW